HVERQWPPVGLGVLGAPRRPAQQLRARLRREDLSHPGTVRTVRPERKSVGPGVLQAVLGELAAALLLAIADPEFQIRVVRIAPAALCADARLALRRRKRRPGAPVCHARPARAPAHGAAAEPDGTAEAHRVRSTG